MSSSSLRRILTGAVALLVVLGGSLFIAKQHAYAATQTNYYVSPSGSDGNSGTDSAHPFATVDHARQVVATINGNMTGDITVNLMAGTYTQSQTLAFTQSDSGTNGYNVIYQANGYGTGAPDAVVLSGGQAITGWNIYDSTKNIYRASVSSTFNTRQLYVNGTRAVRANLGNGLPGTITRTATGYTTTDTTPQSWTNASDIEFVYTGTSGGSGSDWTQSRCGVASITGSSNSTTITMKQPCWTNGSVNKCCGQTLTNPGDIENAYQFLTQAGQWDLDRSAHYLYYIPRSGENLASSTVIAPIVDTLLTLDGTLSNPVQNIQFKGLTFAYATWLQPSGNDGLIDLQAGCLYLGTTLYYGMMPGSINIHVGKNLRFERNTFIHLGATGLAIDMDTSTTPNSGSQGNTIIGNDFTDISGSGIALGSYYTQSPSDTRLYNSNNAISDNYVHDVGVEYRSMPGIVLGYTANSTISHNEVQDVPYSGIADGLTVNPSYAANNRITNNLITNVMTQLADGGSIYTHGSQGTSLANGLVIDSNVMHDQFHERNTLYTDDLSQYITMTNNVMYDNQNQYDWSGCRPVGDFDFENNFYQKPIDTAWCITPARVTDQNNTQISGSCGSNTTCQNIVNNAGLEAAYQNVKDALGPGMTTIDDIIQGNGDNQFQYTGSGWIHPTFTYNYFFNNTLSQSTAIGAQASITFTGTQIAVWAAQANDQGIVAFAIDNGSPTSVDLYSSGNYLVNAVWTSPTLSAGKHTLTMTITGKNASSSNSWFEFDRVVITA